MNAPSANSMEINLHNESFIADVKNTFHKRFPFLRLEFFYPITDERKRYRADNMITDANTRLGEIAGMNKPGYVRINEYRSVGEVEHCFRDCFGLYVQIFRKSGTCWIETLHTDELTLAEQNQLGMEKEAPLHVKYEEEDIYEQE